VRIEEEILRRRQSANASLVYSARDFA